MEKKRVLVIALCLILMTVVISSAASTFNVNTVARLNISGTTASCMGSVVADKTTDSISATMRLWRGNTCIATWNGTGSGSLLMNKTKAVTSGYSYKVTVDASVNGVKQARVTSPVKNC